MMRRSEWWADASAAAQSRAGQPLGPPLTATMIERFVDCSGRILSVVRSWVFTFRPYERV